MGVYKDQFSMETLAGKPTYVDVTEDVSRIVVASGIKEGVCHSYFVPYDLCRFFRRV